MGRSIADLLWSVLGDKGVQQTLGIQGVANQALGKLLARGDWRTVLRRDPSGVYAAIWPPSGRLSGLNPFLESARFDFSRAVWSLANRNEAFLRAVRGARNGSGDAELGVAFLLNAIATGGAADIATEPVIETVVDVFGDWMQPMAPPHTEVFPGRLHMVDDDVTYECSIPPIEGSGWVTVGRRGCDVTLPTDRPDVGDIQFAIAKIRGGQYFIVDGCSPNGTYVEVDGRRGAVTSHMRVVPVFFEPESSVVISIPGARYGSGVVITLDFGKPHSNQCAASASTPPAAHGKLRSPPR